MKSLILGLAFMFIGTAGNSDSKVNLEEEVVACETWATFQPCGESSKFYLCQDGRSLDNLIDAAIHFGEIKCN